MKWSKFIISTMLLFVAAHAVAGDSIYTSQPAESRYDRRVHRYRKSWASLIPTQMVAQNAGNMGLFSVGFGWDYGKRRQWETDLMFGYIPRNNSNRGKLTVTLKENFIPWSISLSSMASIEPLTASLYLNTVYGHEFWGRQPNRYPNDYYQFMSTKFRFNLAFGQRVTLQIPRNRRKHAKSVSLFYEVGTCDLYVRAKFQDSSVPLKDILGLSLGLKFQTL